MIRREEEEEASNGEEERRVELGAPAFAMAVDLASKIGQLTYVSRKTGWSSGT